MTNQVSSSSVVVALAAVAVLAGFLLPFWGGEDPAHSLGGDAFWAPGAGGAGHAYAQAGTAPFVTTWRTTAPNQPITIPVGGAAGTYTIDWGDGTVDRDVAGDRTHRYGTAGTYTVSISGDFTRINLESSSPPNTGRLKSIEQWGDTRWTTMEGAFVRAFDVVSGATDTPDLSSVTDTSRMFWFANLFNGDLSGWDVSNVRDMGRMFESAQSFNGDLSAWDVSSVTNMNSMFWGADAFNGDLSAWDVSSVTDMTRMFLGTDRFNGDLSGWDVSSVRTMHRMFAFTESFNRDLSAWDVSSVTDMSYMFQDADAFNGDLSAWDVSSVTDMSNMFWGTDRFNGDISGWDVSNVRDMHGMFLGADAFNGDISGWDVSNVRHMNDMFDGADVFDQNLGGWYIVLDDTSIDVGEAPGVVGSVRAQNTFLDAHDPVYGIGSGGDSGSFEMDGSDLVLKVVPAKESYTVTVTSTGEFGSGNSRTLEVRVSGQLNTPPTAEAGPDLAVGAQSTMTLAGSVSDPDDDDLAYEWQQSPPTPVVIFDDRTSLTPTITVPSVDSTTTVTLILTVSDGAATVSDSLVLTIEAALDDTTAPVPVLSAPPVTNASSVGVAVDFGEPINATTFAASDVSVSGGGTASGMAQDGADGQRFTVTVGAPDSDGRVDVSVPAGRVADLAGNANVASNQVSVTFDRTAPVITVHGASPVVMHAGDAYADPGAACLDNLDGDLTGSMAVSSDVDAAVPGTYSVIYTCMDGAGNSARAVRAVEVGERPAPTGADDQVWTVEELVAILGSKGEHRFSMIAKCDKGVELTGATVGLRLEGLLGKIGANPIGGPVSSYWIDIDVDASRLDHLGYWDLAAIYTNTANAKIAYTALDYGITLDQYMDAGPDAVFEYPNGNLTKSHLGSLDAYVAGVDWSGEGSCGVEWLRD